MSFIKPPRQYKVSDGIRCAGTMDLKAYLRKLGRIYVIDFKTGTRPKDTNGYPEWPLQTAKYRQMETGAEGNAIVHLDKTTGYPQFYDYSDTYETDVVAFNLLLEFWHNRYSGKLKNGHAPSVTEVLKICDKSGPLMGWAVNCMRDYLHEKIDPKHALSTDALFALIEEARKNFRTVSQKALDIGSQVHEMIAAYLRTGVEPKVDSETVLSAFVAFLEFKDEYGIEPLEIEKTLYG